MAIMRIGLCVSIMTLVRWLAPFLAFIMPLACEKNSPTQAGVIATDNIDKFQKDTLEKIDDEWLALDIMVEPIGEPKQIFRNVALNSLAHEALILEDVVRVTGHVQGIETPLHREAASFSSPTPDVVLLDDSFTDFLAIPDNNNALSKAEHPDAIKGKLRPDGSFLMRLLANQTYWLIFNPEGMLDKAPLVFLIKPFHGDEEITLTPAKPWPLTGKIMASGNFSLSSFLENAQIKAYRGERQLSSLSRPAKDGSFFLELANMNEEALKEPLYLEIINPSKDITWPTFRVPLDKKALSNVSGVEVSLGDMGTPKPALIDITNAKNGEAVDAEVILKAKVGNGEVSIATRLNEKGQARIENVWPALYDLAIIPTNESSLGLLTQGNVDWQNSENFIFTSTLEKRPKVTINVKDYQSENKDGFQIEIARIKQKPHLSASELVGDHAVKRSFAVNNEGVVCGVSEHQKNTPELCPSLLLDYGKYLAHIIPSPGSLLSEKWLSFDVNEEKNFLDIELRKPILFKGNIKRKDNSKLGKMAYVTTFWSSVYDAQAPQTIANSFAHEDGLFEILLVPPHGMFSE